MPQQVAPRRAISFQHLAGTSVGGLAGGSRLHPP
jgi:hypothetical protein